MDPIQALTVRTPIRITWRLLPDEINIHLHFRSGGGWHIHFFARTRFNFRRLNGITSHWIQQTVSLLNPHSFSALQSFVADFIFIQKWKDERLRYPNSSYKFFAMDTIWLNDIWRPDATFRNAKSIELQTVTSPNHYLRFHPDKTLFYAIKLSLRSSCSMNFAFFPHDTQRCGIMVETCKLSLKLPTRSWC